MEQDVCIRVKGKYVWLCLIIYPSTKQVVASDINLTNLKPHQVKFIGLDIYTIFDYYAMKL